MILRAIAKVLSRWQPDMRATDMTKIANLDFAKLDLDREARQGFPEAIFGPGKTAMQIIAIANTMLETHDIVLATKVSEEVANVVIGHVACSTYHKDARMLTFGDFPAHSSELATVAIACAGTSDIPIAQEAALTLASKGVMVRKVFDVGVAGIHRLFQNLDEFKDVGAVIVVAGMDGALPSVVAGLISAPIIAVPTSIGYGSNFEGLSALLTMLNSCAPGITVVNIDNGFGAAVAAWRIIRPKTKNCQ